MSEPYGQVGRVFAGCLLLGVLAGCLVWAGATTGDLTETAYPNEADVTSDRAAYVGEQVVLGGFVVDTDPVVIATRASGYGQFTLVDADARLHNGDGPLEEGDRVNAFGTLEDESTLAVERTMTRESSETRYMYVASALGGLWVVGRFLRHWRVDRSALAIVPRTRLTAGSTIRNTGRTARDVSSSENRTDQDDRTAADGGDRRA